MKKLFISILLLAFTGILSAQEYHNTIIDTTSARGEHDVGWIRSHIADNWTIYAHGGGNIYFGYEDGKGALLDRIGGKTELHVGRWIFPVVGVSAGIGFANSHGYISSDSYIQHRSDLTKDYGDCEGMSYSSFNIGGNNINGALGGYYWTVDGNSDILHQDWRYIYLGADLLVNLSFMKPYDVVNLEKKWNHIVYAGYNIRVGLSEAHPQKFSNFIGYSTEYHGFKNTNFANEGHVGYMAKYALTKHLNLHGDLRLSIMEGDFDRERIPNVEKFAPDMELSVMAGLTYDFNLRSDEKRLAYFIQEGLITPNSTEVPKFIAYIQIEDVDIIQKIDSLLIVQHDTIDDINTITYKQELTATRQKLIEQYENIPTSTPLETILSKRMLPYEMVFFELDKWGILPTEEMKIAKMARIMKAFPEYTFTLYGSADSKTGTVKRNEFLSHQRADTVYNKLINQYGIPASQLRREYMGGILDYDPYPLNRATVIIMDHPAVRRAFEEMKSQRKAGGGITEY